MKKVLTTDKNIDIFRGKRPDTHELLKTKHIKHRIDLQSGSFELFHDDYLEDEDPEDFNIDLHDFKFSNMLPPKLKDINKILDIINNANGHIYIHCLHGKDRTGFVCACIRFCQGWGFKQAVSEMFKDGYHKVPYILWLPKLYLMYLYLKK